MITPSKQTKTARFEDNKTLAAYYKHDLKRNYVLYLLFLPVLAYYIVFCYAPMYGAVIAFKDFSPAKGIIKSAWTSMGGFKHFYDFFTSNYFWRIFGNTIKISSASLIFGFPAPIILALMINEVKSPAYKRTIQSISYIPHFISLVVVAGMIKTFVSDTGFINIFLTKMGLSGGENMLNVKEYFVPIYVLSGIWQEVGWGTIIYLAALTAIDTQLYEAASIDGAGKWRQLFAITLPSIMPTIIMLLVLKIGSLMSVGYEKIILLYNPVIYESSDVISSFVYRKGLMEADYSYSTAVGLFNSVINFALLIFANTMSRKLNETSLW